MYCSVIIQPTDGVSNTNTCDENATHHFVWAWGDEGDCCDTHRTQLLQLSEQLSRTINFVRFARPTQPPPPADSPELRDAKAEILNLEQLLNEQRERCTRYEETIAELQRELVLTKGPGNV
jgi:hypothetical protein